MTDPKKVPLTGDAIKRLKEELLHREGSERQRIIESISTARSHGDLSENAEYHAAREEQAMNEARIREVRRKLENAEVIEIEDDGVVTPGKLVTIKHTGDKESETYLLATREEKGGEFDVLTPESPLGRALVGRSAGETVVATVPAGDLRIEILDVKAL